MGKFVYAIVCCLIVFHNMGAEAHEDDCKTLTMGGHPDFAPVIWSDDEKMRGAIPDIAQLILKGMGVEIVPWDKQPYKRIQKHFQAGRIDLLGGMARTDSRDKFTEYVSPAVTEVVPYVFTNVEDVFSFQSWDQLKKLRGAMQSGMSFGDDFDKYAEQNLNIAYVGKSTQALKLLARGRVDYVVHHYRRAQIEIDLLNYEGQVVALDNPLGGGVQPLYFGFSRQSPCYYLAEEFGHRLQHYKETGVVKRLLNTYMWKFGFF